MIEPAPQTPGGRPHRAPADPLQMSVAEKLACEWEARHDVAARGRIVDPAPVQHYLTHARCEDNRHATGAAHRPRHVPAAPSETPGTPNSGLRGWLRWGEDGAAPSSGSGIPRGC
jgi:hypothetical protein